MTEPQQTGADRRKFARFEVLEYAFVHAPQFEQPVSTVVMDVSLGGLRLRAKSTFDSGETYLVELGYASGDRVTVRAEARFTGSCDDSGFYSTGFKCVPASKQERMGWVDYVHRIFQSNADKLVS